MTSRGDRRRPRGGRLQRQREDLADVAHRVHVQLGEHLGGVKQKLLAAHRAGVTTVLIPQRNEPDLDDVPAEVLAKLDVHPVSDVREVLALALEPASTGAATIAA